MVETLKVKFVESRLLDNETDPALVVVFGQIDDELGKLFAKSGG